MARKIKFGLLMPDGTNITTLEDLQNHIKNNDDLSKLVEYFLDGRLERWLEDRYYEEEAKSLQTVDKDDPNFTCKLCKAIGADYTPVGSVNIELIEYEKKMRKALEEVTLESELLSNAGSTASSQSDLVFLLKNGKSTIYLWGDSFKLFVMKNISYIGILGKPSVDIGLPDLESIKSYGIKLENVKLPERFNPNPFKNAKVGDYVKFGSYPQTSNGQNQPIEWQVLSKENNRMLVISRYGLGAKRFDSSSNNWSNSEIRKWLNGDFYNKAFTDQEKKSINLSNLSDVGTSDNVFFLSYDEAVKYFANNELRKCKATEYVLKKNNWDKSERDGYFWWWLRSPYPNLSHVVYCVFDDGLIRLSDYCCVNYDNHLARPALWINLGNTFESVNIGSNANEERMYVEDEPKKDCWDDDWGDNEEKSTRKNINNWFCGKDVCDVLDNEEKSTRKNINTDFKKAGSFFKSVFGSNVNEERMYVEDEDDRNEDDWNEDEEENKNDGRYYFS